MLLAVRISSYGCTWEVWRALKKLELLSAIASSNSYASFVLSKFPLVSITRYTHAKHEPILNSTQDCAIRTITRTINFLSRTIRLQKSAQFSFFSRTLSKGLCSTVEAPLATTSHKRPPLLSD